MKSFTGFISIILILLSSSYALSNPYHWPWSTDFGQACKENRFEGSGEDDPECNENGIGADLVLLFPLSSDIDVPAMNYFSKTIFSEINSQLKEEKYKFLDKINSNILEDIENYDKYIGVWKIDFYAEEDKTKEVETKYNEVDIYGKVYMNFYLFNRAEQTFSNRSVYIDYINNGDFRNIDDNYIKYIIPIKIKISANVDKENNWVMLSTEIIPIIKDVEKHISKDGKTFDNFAYTYIIKSLSLKNSKILDQVNDVIKTIYDKGLKENGYIYRISWSKVASGKYDFMDIKGNFMAIGIEIDIIDPTGNEEIPKSHNESDFNSNNLLQYIYFHIFYHYIIRTSSEADYEYNKYYSYYLVLDYSTVLNSVYINEISRAGDKYGVLLDNFKSKGGKYVNKINDVDLIWAGNIDRLYIDGSGEYDYFIEPEFSFKIEVPINALNENKGTIWIDLPAIIPDDWFPWIGKDERGDFPAYPYQYKFANKKVECNLNSYFPYKNIKNYISKFSYLDIDGAMVGLISYIDKVDDGASPDSDKDGIPDVCDNCPSNRNRYQINTDRSIEKTNSGDACDDDIDGDTLLNKYDFNIYNKFMRFDFDKDNKLDFVSSINDRVDMFSECKEKLIESNKVNDYGRAKIECEYICKNECRRNIFMMYNQYYDMCRFYSNGSESNCMDLYDFIGNKGKFIRGGFDYKKCIDDCNLDNCTPDVIVMSKNIPNRRKEFYENCSVKESLGYKYLSQVCNSFGNESQSDIDRDGIGDACDMDQNSYYNIEMSQSPKIDYKEEICSLSENFNIIGKKVNKIYDTVADLSVFADLRKSYKNRETGLEFDFNNDSFDKLEIGIIPEDVTIGVCYCKLSNGNSVEKCRERCPLFKDNGEPIDFKNGSRRRYYNPITTYSESKGDDICNEHMSPPINYAGFTQACLKKAYPKKVYYGISQYGGNYRWDFSYFPVVEELVMNGWSNVLRGIDIASFIINTPEDDGKYSQIRIATTRNAKGEYQKFGIDGCRFGEKNCIGRWHKLYDKIEEGCVPLIPDMRDIGNCPITGGECPWELDKTAVIDFGSRFGSRIYWDLPPDKIGIKFDRRVIMMFDTRDGGITDGKFVGIYNPVSGKIERLFDSKAGNTVYPSNGLKRYSLSVGYSSLSRLGISSDDIVREIMFVYGGEINGRLDNTLYVGWFDDEGVRWRSVYFDSYVPMLGIYVPMPKAKDAYVGYDEVRNMIFIGDGVGENIFGEFGEMREDWIVGIWSYQFGSREGTVDFWRILPEQREIGEDNWDIDAAQIYDSERGKWVLFGGVGRDGVMDWIWEMDTGDYYGRVIEGGMSGGPGRRAGMAIYYDRTYRKVYLMGGYDELGRLHNDIWEYDMRTGLWREVVGDRGEIPRVKGGTIYYSPEKGIFSYYGGKYEGEGMGGIFYYDERYGRWYIPKINPWMNVAYLNNMEYFEGTYTRESKEDIRVAVSGEDSVSPEVVMLKMEEGSGKIGVEVRDRVMREVIGYGKRSSPEEYVSVWGVNGDEYEVRIKRREGYSEGEVYNYRLSSKRVEISDKAVDKIKEKGIKKILRDGDYLYVLSFEDGLSVYDISDAKNPERVWNNKVLTIGSDMEVLEDYLYVVVPAGLMVIDKRDKRNLSVVGYERLIGYSRELEIVGDYAYVTGGVFGVFVVNISDRKNPKWEDTRLKFMDVYEEIEVKGDKIILGGKIKGDVQIYRDNGMDFEYVGKVDRRGEVKGMVVRGDRMYLRYSKKDGYEVYRIKVAGDPEYIGKYEIKKGDVDRIRGEYIGKYYYGIERNGKGIKIYELK
jgi:hypothetical protein